MDLDFSKLKYPPNEYTKPIFLESEKKESDLVINAVAGGGKTTLLLSLTKLHPDASGIIIAFNRSIADELSNALPGNSGPSFGGEPSTEGWRAKTVHQAGNEVLKSNFDTKLEKWKTSNIIRSLTDPLRMEWKAKKKLRSEARKLVGLMKLTLTDPEDTDGLDRIIEHHGYGSKKNILKHTARTAYNQSLEVFKESGEIDFNDMIWLPIHLDLELPKYEYVFVDECQDLNKLQYEFSRRMLKEGGQAIYVGDPNQAIYGFAGANAESFDYILEESDAKSLPLSVCYRCDRKIISVAQELVPRIKPRKDAGEGETHAINERDLPILASEGDMVLCRLNSPLLTGCVRALRQGKRARIKGLDFGRQLTKKIEEIGPTGTYDPDRLKNAISIWEKHERRELVRNDASKSALQRIEDLAEAMRTCIDLFPNVGSVDHLKDEINFLFSDDDANYLWFSTIHKAKGLEAENIFIIEPNTLPLVFPESKEWELEQEYNLKYVAITRAKKRLIVAHKSEDWAEKGYGRDHSIFKSRLFGRAVRDKSVSKEQIEKRGKELFDKHGTIGSLSQLFTNREKYAVQT